MSATLAKCKCQHCNQKIEFDSDSAGTTIPCPKCGLDTLLFVPPVAPHPLLQTEIPALTPCAECRQPISRRAVLCPTCGAVPSLFRVGWYVLCIMASMSLITALIGFVIWAFRSMQ
jgi:Zn finger protein HypA/HybF involved in hydrogenase expression